MSAEPAPVLVPARPAPGRAADFLRGGGEMGLRMREFPWTDTPLGDPAQWPPSLRTAVRIMLTSRQPKFVWWGEQLVNLYNDPYAAILGARHPRALGRPAEEVWAEIWDEIGPRAHRVLDRDEGVFEESLPLLMERNGYPEETYFTFSYSPIPGDDGRPGGIICACVEDTSRIIGEQQLALLQQLASCMASARTAPEACEGAAAALSAHSRLAPFALLYLVTGDGLRARLAGCAGLEPGSAAAPEWLSTEAPPWKLSAALQRACARVVELPAAGVDIDLRPQPRRALMLPIVAAGERQPLAVLVAALNPQRPCGEAHVRFMEVVAAQIAAGLVKAQGYEAEARRAETLARLRADAEVLVDLAREIGGELELGRLVQKITDAGVRLTAGAYGAFFHNAGSGHKPGELSHALSGNPRNPFVHLGLLRSTQPFATTYSGAAVVRCEDLEQHPVHAAGTLPESDAPVRSYLAVPVRSRSGRVLGGLFFGHPQPGVFDERAERLALGVAAQAAVAIDNAHAYRDATLAIERSIRSESAYRSSERRYRALVDAMPIAVYTCDAQGVVTLCNRAATELWGREPVIGRDLWCGSFEIFSPEDGSPVPLEECPMAQALRGCRAIHGAEIVVGRPDGSRRNVLVYPRPLFDDHGKVNGAINILVDVTDRKRVEDELRRSDQRKNEFLAILAHELRNPLAPIRNGIEVLKRARPDGVAALQARALMERQVGNMVRLVDDLLDLSRITRGLVELRRAPLDVGTTLRGAVEACRALAEAAGHELRLELPDVPAEALADATRLEQVFINLLNNAVRYTPGGGQIRAWIETDASSITVHVADNGIGISENMQSRIFEMFTQADRSLERSTGGLGIGLTLAQRLVAMHDGTIEVRSAGHGMGSEFVVHLPRVGAGSELRDVVPAVPVAREATARRWRILVVDDHADAAASMALMLGIRGDEVRVAHNGVDAIAAIGGFRPHLVLMDIGMPVLNGYEACRRIRRLEQGKEIMLVAMTGWGQAEDKQRSREAGFDEHWVKPVDAALIERLIAELPQRLQRLRRASDAA